MGIKFCYDNALKNSVRKGITKSVLVKQSAFFAPRSAAFIDGIKKGEMGFSKLPLSYKNTVKEINTAARQIRKKFKNFVVLGIGGSALGNIMLQNSLNSLFYNEIKTPKIYALDNVDPDYIAEFLETINVKDTCFNVITKSGTTAETMSTFLIFKEMLVKKLGKNYKNNIIITTDAEKGILRPYADKEKIKSFVIPADVGGRFSVLTPVGLLSAAVSGINIEELMEGAASMRRKCLNKDIMKNPAHLFSLITYLFDKKQNRKMTVMLPYSNHLKDFADWFRQLWAESLGKEKDLNGRKINCGLTPIKSLGATDQHSQLQLYLEGPDDKLIVFLTVKNYGGNITIPKSAQLKELDYIKGHSLNELIHAEASSTELALTRCGKPNVKFEIDKINAGAVGMLIYLFEHATAFSGVLYNINPFDQPAVELGKHFTYGLLGREGYNHKLKEFKKYYKNPKDFISVK